MTKWETITSRKQQPKEEWLKYVMTARAKHKIKQALREQKRKLAIVGKEAVQRKLRAWGAKVNDENIGVLGDPTSPHRPWTFTEHSRERHDLDAMDTPPVKNGRFMLCPRASAPKDERPLEEIVAEIRGTEGGTFTIGEELLNMDYKLSPPAATPFPATTSSASSPPTTASASTA